MTHKITTIVLVNEIGETVTLPLLALQLRPNGNNKTDLGYALRATDEKTSESKEIWAGILTFDAVVSLPKKSKKNRAA